LSLGRDPNWEAGAAKHFLGNHPFYKSLHCKKARIFYQVEPKWGWEMGDGCRRLGRRVALLFSLRDFLKDVFISTPRNARHILSDEVHAGARALRAVRADKYFRLGRRGF